MYCRCRNKRHCNSVWCVCFSSSPLRGVLRRSRHGRLFLRACEQQIRLRLCFGFPDSPAEQYIYLSEMERETERKGCQSKRRNFAFLYRCHRKIYVTH